MTGVQTCALPIYIPSRGLIGLRTQTLTATTGEAVMAHRFTEYKPWKGPILGRNNGVLISKFQDKTTGYSIDKLQDRGTFFVDPGEENTQIGTNAKAILLKYLMKNGSNDLKNAITSRSELDDLLDITTRHEDINDLTRKLIDVSRALRLV